jgi:hypothetical protein
VEPYPRGRSSLQWTGVAIDSVRTRKGAFAGAVAATVWLLQQPLDKRVFGTPHDDAELLGRLTGMSRAGGTALHVANGAAFGAVYSAVAHKLPLAPPLRGPAVALLEHLATWPLTASVAPELTTSPRAFAQSAWRHLLFGAVLGELERRLNPPRLEPVSDEAVASNGHGSAAHLVATGPD